MALCGGLWDVEEECRGPDLLKVADLHALVVGIFQAFFIIINGDVIILFILATGKESVGKASLGVVRRQTEERSDCH